MYLLKELGVHDSQERLSSQAIRVVFGFLRGGTRILDISCKFGGWAYQNRLP